MIGDASQLLGGWLGRLAAHSRDPLYRNGYALMASSGVTSVLGLAYWIIAARLYPAEAVGFNAAAISAMMFLAGLAQLNLISALVRFVPEAGRQARALVVAAYGITVTVALVASLVFAGGAKLWAPALAAMFASPQLLAWFVVATMAWGVFVLEDSAMTGLRRAIYVPFSNGLFAVFKIALLVFVAGFAPAFGIFGSWTAALLVSLVLTNALIFGRLLPRHLAASPPKPQGLSVRKIATFLSADYVASLFWLSCTTLLPVIVTSIAGVRANAYFYLAWQIGYSLHILTISTGSSLVVEAVLSRDELASQSRRVFVNNLRITVPVALLVVILAPYLMRIFGSDYAAQGTTLLRYLALGAVPFSFVSLAISVARVQTRMRRVVGVLASMCVIVLALTAVLLRTIGLTGVGVAWLSAQTLLAAVVLVTQLLPLWLPHMPSVSSVVREARAAIRRARFGFGFLRVPDEVLTSLASAGNGRAGTGLAVLRTLSVTTDVAVVALGSPSPHHAVAVLKLARTPHGEVRIKRSVEVAEKLRADPRLAGMRQLIPEVLAEGKIGRHDFVSERILEGVDGRALIRDPSRRPAVVASATGALGRIQRQLSESVVVDEVHAATWIDEPIQMIARLAERHRGIAQHVHTLEELREDLRAQLLHRTASVGLVHGDFVPGNVIADPDTGAVSGIIDWEQAELEDLQVLDVMQFLLATRIVASGGELGDVVCELLQESALSADEKAALEAGPVSPLAVRQLVLLSWLRHLAGNLGKSREYKRHSWWIRRNVLAVLQALERSSPRRARPRLRVVGASARTGQVLADRAIRPIPILLYHSVSRDPSAETRPYAVTPETFAQHLDLLTGRPTLTVAELIALLDRGEPIPEGAVVVTFDDGFADNLEIAAPLLAERKVHATMFVTSGYVGELSGHVPGRMLSWSGVRELRAAGFEVGAHGHMHLQLDIMPIIAARSDVMASKSLLEQGLGEAVSSFAYPHGYRTASVRRAVREAGFDCACGVKNALSHPQDDRWSLARLTVRDDTPVDLVAAWIRGEGAPVAQAGDQVQTVAWRNFRRLAATFGGAL